MTENIRLYLFRFRQIIILYLFSLILFSAWRYLYLHHVIAPGESALWKEDIGKAFITGLRFDTVTICYGLLLPVLLIFSGLFIKNNKWQKFIDKFNRVFLTIIFTLFIFLLVTDYYYYNYFQSHINVLIFGFWEDDTGNVLKSVYTDYPLIRIILFIVLVFFFFRFLLRKIQVGADDFLRSRSALLMWLFAIVTTGLFAIGLRGSFGTFPVQVDDANISGNAKVNLLPVNGVFALKEVLHYGLMQGKLAAFDEEIEKIGYENKEKALQDYFGNRSNIHDHSIWYTKSRTNSFAEKNPPNVIIFLMESMSNHNLDLNAETLNVLGALEKYYKNGIVFRKFLPAQNGTINSLEGLLINTPVTSLAQSKFGADTFPSAAAKPFYDRGYATSFITGGKLNWRNINTLIPRQYFTSIEGDADIKAANPATTECEWGVYDEFLFDHVFEKLKHTEKPQFIFALTTTNHTPFHLPENYRPYPVNLNDSIRKILQTEEPRAINNLTNFQYSNDCLGRFLDKLSSSPFGNNTIVFATGDHNNLLLFDFTEEQLYDKLSVPLVMYIPPAYLQGSLVDTSRWGSHKDIFPTLYNLAISDAEYFNAGNDLLSASADKASYFGIDIMSFVAMDDRGAVRFDRKPEVYEWSGPLKLKSVTNKSTDDSLMVKARSYFASFYHYIKEVTEKK